MRTILSAAIIVMVLASQAHASNCLGSYVWRCTSNYGNEATCAAQGKAMGLKRCALRGAACMSWCDTNKKNSGSCTADCNFRDRTGL